MIDEQKQKEAQKTVSWVLDFLEKHMSADQIFLSTAIIKPRININAAFFGSPQSWLAIHDIHNEMIIYMDGNPTEPINIVNLANLEGEQEEAYNHFINFPARMLKAYQENFFQFKCRNNVILTLN